MTKTSKFTIKTEEDVERFLSAEFPELPFEQVMDAFDWAFFGGQYEPTDTKKVWAKRIKILRRDSGTDETAELEEIWHRNNPKTGGADPADYMVADWVKMAFEELGARISFGISAEFAGAPSTRFGRVVQAAFAYRNLSTNWRRPAQNLAEQLD